MAAMFLSLLCVVFVLSSYTSATYKVAQRRLQTSNDWQLIDSWTFESGYVRFNYNVTFPRNYSPMKLLFYRQDQYNQANDQSKSCEDKVAVLQFAGSGQQILNFELGMTQYGCRQRYDSMMGDSVNCNGYVTFNVNRGMMWYVVANRCGTGMTGTQGIDLWYYIDNMNENNARFPMFSGQSKATFTALALVPFLVLKQCLA